jgi:Zn-dependent alcohol dehydrogenase
MAQQEATGLGASAFTFTALPEAPTLQRVTPEALAARACGCGCGCSGGGGAGGGGGSIRAQVQSQ